jgi:hypothetical protein
MGCVYGNYHGSDFPVLSHISSKFNLHALIIIIASLIIKHVGALFTFYSEVTIDLVNYIMEKNINMHY